MPKACPHQMPRLPTSSGAPRVPYSGPHRRVHGLAPPSRNRVPEQVSVPLAERPACGGQNFRLCSGDPGSCFQSRVPSHALLPGSPTPPSSHPLLQLFNPSGRDTSSSTLRVPSTNSLWADLCGKGWGPPLHHSPLQHPLAQPPAIAAHQAARKGSAPPYPGPDHTDILPLLQAQCEWVQCPLVGAANDAPCFLTASRAAASLCSFFTSTSPSGGRGNG